ncbi:hypothetical protein [Streptococcus pneumoniae]|uniref:hypothetical protein n=1 Tax=Streptococcus pneumoniae TaxID=1313 RepID=UPI000B139AB4
MRKLTNLLAALCLLLFVSCRADKEYYVFTSFHEPADAGLRYLVSRDGRHWDSIPGTWLKPALGQHKLMRDPSIARTPDGTYHLVWTTSWKGDLGFGHATSRDLIHWSEQEMIPVMPAYAASGCRQLNHSTDGIGEGRTSYPRMMAKRLHHFSAANGSELKSRRNGPSS